VFWSSSVLIIFDKNFQVQNLQNWEEFKLEFSNQQNKRKIEKKQKKKKNREEGLTWPKPSSRPNTSASQPSPTYHFDHLQPQDEKQLGGALPGARSTAASPTLPMEAADLRTL
jgi:hypothetical protein